MKIDWPVLKRNWYLFLAVTIGSIAGCFDYVQKNYWWVVLILLTVGYFGILFREAKYSNGSRIVR